MFIFSLIKKESKFCLKCMEEKYTLCNRVLKEMLKTNSKRNLTSCPDKDIKDGHWTEFKIMEKCKGIEQVGNHSNYTCGVSRTIEKKDCVRDLGGQYCKDDEEQDVEEDILVKTVKCNDTECPGIIRKQVNWS